ncbi:MAG: hypothetical protein IJB33_00695 [Akkermansia sp.]|nr:hypothetical protein [Akkermansia sp.]
MKIATIFASTQLFLASGLILPATSAAVHLPMASALWGFLGTTVLLYWPQDHPVLLLMKSWLCTILFGSAIAMLADCCLPHCSAGHTFLCLLPFFLLLTPCIVFLLRHLFQRLTSQYRCTPGRFR